MKETTGAVALAFFEPKKLPTGAAGGFRRPGEIYFYGLPPLKRLSFWGWPLMSGGVQRLFRNADIDKDDHLSKQEVCANVHFGEKRYRGTSLIRNCLLPGPYSRTIPRALRWS